MSEEVYDWDGDLEALTQKAIERFPQLIQRSDIKEWKLDINDLAMKACAIQHDDGSRYGLIIARRDEDGQFDDPRNLTRGQLETIRDFIEHVLEEEA